MCAAFFTGGGRRFDQTITRTIQHPFPRTAMNDDDPAEASTDPRVDEAEYRADRLPQKVQARTLTAHWRADAPVI
jgi:hypothetical protein